MNKNFFICGNGGSGANAIHIANDFLYGAGISNKRGLKVESLTSNPAVLTCLANDIGYEKIFSEQKGISIKSGRKKLTIFFSDIVSFTNITEQLEPEELTALLNYYLNEMSELALEYGGTIDKFMGDCIMAFWNAPIENNKHRDMAIKSAIEMQVALKELNTQLMTEGLPEINIGIGINTGEALVGNMGSEQRFDYSVIGDAVNLASRLESSSKTLGKTLVIGDSTVKGVEKDYNFEFVDEITVKGKSEKVKVYTINNFR